MKNKQPVSVRRVTEKVRKEKDLLLLLLRLHICSALRAKHSNAFVCTQLELSGKALAKNLLLVSSTLDSPDNEPVI